MIKIILPIMLLSLPMLGFSQEPVEFKKDNLIGKWACIVNYKDDDGFGFSDQFTETLSTNGVAITLGVVKYNDGQTQANVKYEYESKWNLLNKEVQFNNFITKHYEIDNKEFEQKYEIDTVFASTPEDVETAHIKQLSKDKLVYMLGSENNGDEYTVSCDKK